MGVLLLIAAGIVAGALFFFLVLRFIEFVSLLALALIGVCLEAIGITSLAVSGIAFAVFFQLFGERHAGWALLSAILVGLTLAGLLFAGALREVRRLLERHYNPERPQ